MSLPPHLAPPQSRLSDVHRTKLADHFTTHGVDCIGEYKINFEDIRALKAFDVPKSPEAPCFFACILKRSQLAPPQSRLSDVHRTKLADHFTTHGVDCIGEYKINFEDIRALKAFDVPKSPEAPCFFACILKRSQLLDTKGMLSKTSALEMAKNVFNDEEEVKLIADYINSCSGVNSEAVSDGDKGCERAVKAFKCMSENAGQFGFEV